MARILVIGAGGFIDRHLRQALAHAGDEAVRATAGPVMRWDDPKAWQPQLAGMDGVVYTADCLRDRAGGATDLLDLLHHRAPAALADACAAAGVRRLVHVSALCGGFSTYARSKHAGDVGLAGRAHIVRPSLVIGPGGSSSRLLDRLAYLPWLPLPAAVAGCRVQPIRVEDLAEGLVALLRAGDAPATWDAMGPEADSLAGWIARRRAASGRPPARLSTVPAPLTALSARVGDLMPIGPWCSTALELLSHDSCAPAGASPLKRPLRAVMQGDWT